MELIDTHAHLNFQAFRDNWEAVVERSLSKNVRAIVMPSSQLETSERAVELAQAKSGQLLAAIGFHPIHVGRAEGDDPQEGKQSTPPPDFGRYRELVQLTEVVAIGEVGLDTYRRPQVTGDSGQVTGLMQEQERVFREFIRIAQEVGKPLIVHVRGAKKAGDPTSDIDPHERVLAILEETAARPKFVVHCYQGTKDQAGRYLKLGGLISFTGTITYTDDPAVTEVVRTIPLERLMIETDSPYLSPVPYRGEPNEPWKVIEVARRVADLQGVSLERVAGQTTVNASDFFGL